MKWLRRILSKEKKSPVVDKELTKAIEEVNALAKECCDVLKEKTAALSQQSDVEQPIVSNETSEGRSVPSVSSTNAGCECEHGAMRDAVKTVHPATGVSQINGSWSQGDKRASVADNVLSAKHAAENPPSSFPSLESKSDPETMIGVEQKKQIEPKPSDVKFMKRHPDEEPPLRPRKEWEKWSKRQGNSGSETHVEWKRRVKEAGIQIGES